MAKKKRKNNRNSNRTKSKYNINDKNSEYYSSTYGIENISEEDLQSLNLLDIQLKATLIVIYAQLLLCEANIQGRQVILNKYIKEEKDDSNINENLIYPNFPDKTVLQATYIFFAMKLVFIEVAFTRYNMNYNKKLNGDFPYSLEPNEIINSANLLDLVSCIYYIKAAEEILARDNNQPVFGIR